MSEKKSDICRIVNDIVMSDCVWSYQRVECDEMDIEWMVNCDQQMDSSLTQTATQWWWR